MKPRRRRNLHPQGKVTTSRFKETKRSRRTEMKQQRFSSVFWGLALAAGAVVLAALLPVVADAADNDTAQVTVTIERYLYIDFENGNDGDVTFELDCDDFERGYAQIDDDGDVYWETNCAPWMICVSRSEWERDGDGDGDDRDGQDWADCDIHLQVKYGPPGGSEWADVDTDTVDWIGGDQPGSGTFQHIDWKIPDIGWDDHNKHGHHGHHYGTPPPGTYTCTVTFTIEYRGS
jgi:hypothetical protein